MKDYVLDKKEASHFIREVRQNPNGTLTVEFADGRVFTGIDACDENIETIIQAQEEQAKKGIAKYKVFKNHKSTSKALTVLSGLGSMAVGTAATFIPAVKALIDTQNPLTVVAGIGAITVLGAIPAYTRFRKDKAVVTELDKLRFRQDHLEDLQNFRNYPNSLSGVNPRVANWMSNCDDPFCILNIDEYDRDDLSQIVDNIEVEKAYQFSYRRRARSK